jgi:hypothetical protein
VALDEVSDRRPIVHAWPFDFHGRETAQKRRLNRRAEALAGKISDFATTNAGATSSRSARPQMIVVIGVDRRKERA